MKPKIDLPYTYEQPRRGGKVAYYFRPPSRAKWDEKNIRLPHDRALRKGDGSPEEIAAVIADAKRLLRRLRDERSLNNFPRGSLADLMAEWRESSHWAGLQPKTKAHYLGAWKHVEAWSAENNHPHIAKLTWPKLVRYMKRFEDRPRTHESVRQLIKMLSDRALDEGYIERSVFEGKSAYRWKVAKRKVSEKLRWDWNHVMCAVDYFDARGWPNIGTATLIGFDLMQYPSMIIAMRAGHEYDPETGEFVFDRDKTGVSVRVTVSSMLRERLAGREGYLVTGRRGDPYRTRTALPQKFRALIQEHPIEDLRAMQMNWLRHSGVFEADRAGLTDRMIASIGGWKQTAEVRRILDKHYRKPDGVLASEGMALREALRVRHVE